MIVATEATFIEYFDEEEYPTLYVTLEGIFFIGWEESGLCQVYCLPDLEI